jgi:inhibitor of cysteine peptidase
MSRLIVTGQDNKSEINLRVGDELLLRLEAQPGTGYSWRVLKDSYELLSQIGQPDFEESDELILGGKEWQVFRYKAGASGMQRLELEYRRWHGVTPSGIEDSFSVTVIIGE